MQRCSNRTEKVDNQVCVLLGLVRMRAFKTETLVTLHLPIAVSSLASSSEDDVSMGGEHIAEKLPGRLPKEVWRAAVGPEVEAAFAKMVNSLTVLDPNLFV